MSLAETYLAKKALLVEKLEDRDIDASMEEGFSTLADKILLITAAETVGEYSKTITIVWNDDNDKEKIRPDSIKAFLTRQGKKVAAVTFSAPFTSCTFTGLDYNDNNYSLVTEDITGYSKSINGLTVTYTLQTGTLNFSLSLIGVPEETDMSALRFVFYGPDPSLYNVTLSQSQLSNNMTYTFGSVLCGAYGVQCNNWDQMIEGYILDSDDSNVVDAVYVGPGETKTLSMTLKYMQPEEYEIEEGFDPESYLNNLSYQILGPDPSLPITRTYSQFSNGQISFPNMVPGTYCVICRNAENLIPYYKLTNSSSLMQIFPVVENGNGTSVLYAEYDLQALPEEEEEFISIPCTITWVDNDNSDLNRPDSVTIRLYADGIEVNSHVCSSAESWSYTFSNEPIYDDGNEITYTINIDVIPLYSTSINGFNITNTYSPEETSSTVSLTWEDNNNSDGLRPSSVRMTLENSSSEIIQYALLEEGNDWTYTVQHLPTIYNGSQITYHWSITEIPLYTSTLIQEGNNCLWTCRKEKVSNPNPPKS